MAAVVVAATARVPGPPELLPGRPDAVVDLQTDEGAALVGGRWRYADARVEEIDFVAPAGPGTPDPLGPGSLPNRTYDVVPHAEAGDFDDSDWEVLAPADTMRRLANGRVCFNWYRIAVTIPERIGNLDPTGTTVVFEVVVDDYAEVWVNGRMPLALGRTGGQVVGGFNAPNRVVLTRDAQPGDRFVIAVIGINGPISASPRNYIWLRSATLELHVEAPAAEAAELRVWHSDAALDDVIGESALERVAGGFELTHASLWSPDGALVFSSPSRLYRLDPFLGAVTPYPVAGPARALALSPEGRLTLARPDGIVRVNPHGDTTVLAADRRANGLVYASDGTLYFTDSELGGVFAVRDGEIALVADELAIPAGIALSPDERHIYVGNQDDERTVVMRYDRLAGGHGLVFQDMTGEGAIGGIQVDPGGHLFICAPGGIWVASPGGERLGLLQLPEHPHDLARSPGGDLYVTAMTSVYRIRRNA